MNCYSSKNTQIINPNLPKHFYAQFYVKNHDILQLQICRKSRVWQKENARLPERHFTFSSYAAGTGNNIWRASDLSNGQSLVKFVHLGYFKVFKKPLLLKHVWMKNLLANIQLFDILFFSFIIWLWFNSWTKVNMWYTTRN